MEDGESMDIKASNQITLMRVGATNIDIGGRNLIRNSINLIYQDYYFLGSGNVENDDIVVNHDADGNIIWVHPAVSITNDGDGNIIMSNSSLMVSDDGAGNVRITTQEMI